MRPLLAGKILPTTVVGSYPVVQGREWGSFWDPLKYAVRTAVSDQVAAGVDIISDGQVRGDMVNVFAGRLPGIRGQSVISKVMASPVAITLADTRYALRRSPFVKGILTGPTTLSHGLRIDTPVYRNRGELALDLAHALLPEAIALEEAGVTLLQIDEPIFSTGMADLQSGVEALQVILSRVKVPVCLHVCGDLSGVIDELIRIPVQVLDFEFAKNPSNLELVSRKDLGGRMIGYGCIDSSALSVDPVSVIRERIFLGITAFGEELMIIDPDCGLRMHTRETAFHKLQNMVFAAREVRSEL
jgi:5-methyltetrahydropteroyltriglutamate--homocysteine methyltransferase